MDDLSSSALQALQEDAWGPRRDFHSPERQRRIAVQEGATALICTLLPAIEPLTYVTIRPRDRRPLGQTVVRTNTQRERTMLYTQRYLKEQLLTVLAGENSPWVTPLLGCCCLSSRLQCQAVVDMSWWGLRLYSWEGQCVPYAALGLIGSQLHVLPDMGCL